MEICRGELKVDLVGFVEGACYVGVFCFLLWQFHILGEDLVNSSQTSSAKIQVLRQDFGVWCLGTALLIDSFFRGYVS